MMRRAASEVRQPGMTGSRRCCQCGAALDVNNSERCIDCRPRLSLQAQAVGAHRRAELEDIVKTERAIEMLETLIRRVNRKDRRLT